MEGSREGGRERDEDEDGAAPLHLGNVALGSVKDSAWRADV